MSLTSIHRKQDGAIAVLVAVLAVALFTISAFAVDLGNAYARTRMSQTDADFAALAGAQQLANGTTAAEQSACNYLVSNLPRSDGSTNPSICDPSTLASYLDNNIDNGEITISPDGTEVTVTIPRRTIHFALGGVVGVNQTSVARSATAGVFSLGSILPLGIPDGCLGSDLGFLTLKASSQSTSGCGDQSTGDFGYLKIYRNLSTGWSTNNTASTLNLRDGVDHGLGSIAATPAPPLTDQPCGPDGSGYTGPAGGTYVYDNPTNDAVALSGGSVPNCVLVGTGLKASILTNAFIEMTNGQCDGRLEGFSSTDFPSGISPADQSRTYNLSSHTCSIDPERLEDFANSPGLDFEAALAADALPPGSISASIVNSPNFFVVPVMYTVDRAPNQNNDWLISGFRGFYIDCNYATTSWALKQSCNPFTYSAGNSGNITGLTGYSFDLSAVQGDLLSRYTGPRCTCKEGIPLLIH